LKEARVGRLDVLEAEVREAVEVACEALGDELGHRRVVGIDRLAGQLADAGLLRVDPDEHGIALAVFGIDAAPVAHRGHALVGAGLVECEPGVLTRKDDGHRPLLYTKASLPLRPMVAQRGDRRGEARQDGAYSQLFPARRRGPTGVGPRRIRLS